MIFGGGSGGAIGTGIVYSLHDNFSATADKIGNKWNKLDGVTAKATANIQKSMNNMKMGFMSMAAGAAMLAPAAIGVVKFAKLSDELADVTKTTGITGKALDDLLTGIEKIDTRTSVSGLLEMAKAGGSMGVAQNDILSFTSAVDKLNVALGDQFQSPEVLARDLTKLRNVLKDVKTDNISNDLLHLGNVLNYMGANAAATESDIFDMANRLSGLQAIAGLSTGEIFGLSTAMSEMGITSETGGTNFSMIIQRMGSNYEKFAKTIGVSSSDFKKMINDDALGAFNLFAEKLTEANPTTTGLSKALKDLGLNGGRISTIFAKYATNIDLVNKRVIDANANLGDTNSIMAEFNAKNETLGAVFEKTGKKFGIAFTTIGKQFAPTAEAIGNGLIYILEKINDFIKSPIGGFIMKLTAIVGALALVIGAVIVATNLSTLASAKASLAFAAMGKTQIAATFASKGLARGLLAVGKSAITALIPLLPYIAILAAIAAPIFLAVKAMKAFDEVMSGTAKKASGFMGFMQKLGGILKAIGHIWKTANSEGFSMSAKLFHALEALGIEKTAIAIGTWIVRIKLFFKGVGAGIKEAWNNVIKPITSAIGTAFEWLMGLFDKLGFSMDRNTSATSRWEETGKIVGIVIMSLLVPAFISLAISVLAATWPILLIIGAVAGIVWAIKNWGKITEWFAKIWGKFTDWIGEKWNAIVGYFKDTSLKDVFIDLGQTILTYLLAPIILLLKLAEKIPGKVGNLASAALEGIGTLTGFDLAEDKEGGLGVGDMSGVGKKNITTELALVNAQSNAAQVNIPAPTILDQSIRTEVVRDINIDMDGSEIRKEIDAGTEEDLNRQ